MLCVCGHRSYGVGRLVLVGSDGWEEQRYWWSFLGVLKAEEYRWRWLMELCSFFFEDEETLLFLSRRRGSFGSAEEDLHAAVAQLSL